MLNIQRINNVYEPLFSKFYALYLSSFPSVERRSWDGLEHELLYEKRFFANAILRNEMFVGFLNYWKFEHFYYIEHFAIIPVLRGQKIGSEALTVFLQQNQLPIILEVEMPNTPLNIRRIEFYKKHGFAALAQNYEQPAYQENGASFAMKVMCNEVNFADENFDIIKEQLFDKVYHQKKEQQL